MFSQANDLEVAHPRSDSSSIIPGRIEIWKCCFFMRGEHSGTRRKGSGSKVENQQQSQTRYGW